MERTTSRRKETAEFAEAEKNVRDTWVAACGGNEEVFTHQGKRYLYVWNPAKQEHGYLNLETDTVSEEAPWN